MAHGHATLTCGELDRHINLLRAMAAAAWPHILPPTDGLTGSRVRLGHRFEALPPAWSTPGRNTARRILLLGDSNDRLMVTSLQGPGLAMPTLSPLGQSCADERTFPRNVLVKYRSGCLCVASNGTAVGNVVVTGTVLYADSAIERRFSNGTMGANDYFSMFVNTTQPTVEGVRAYMRWQKHPPELVVLHSGLRDLYTMCRRSAPPGAPEKEAWCLTPDG